MITETLKQSRKYRFLINGGKIFAGVLALLFSIALLSCAATADKQSPMTDRNLQGSIRQMIDSIEADPAMGDWQGSLTSYDGTTSGLVAQVIALGEGKYQANLLTEFDKRIEPVDMLEGQARKDGTVQFRARSEKGEIRSTANGAIEDGQFSGQLDGMVGASFLMHKVIRLSPTMGAKPPAGAIVLFDGKNFDEWEYVKKKPVQDSELWRLFNGVMEVEPGRGSIVTKKKFTDFKLHLEFRTPFMPESPGQKRGNSGVYLQERYEVQILDSYGLEGKDNECGGIYKVAAPGVNMCSPPMQWQSYDITFQAARFDTGGEKISNTRLTVQHNGVRIHDNVEVQGPTGAASRSDENQPGGICLQNHGNAVQFRNIWLVELP